MPSPWSVSLRSAWTGGPTETGVILSQSSNVYNRWVKHIGTQLRKNLSKTRETERGELMKYFVQKLNRGRLRDGLPQITMGRMGKLFEKIPTKDLYYLKRVCDDAPNFSKKFWWLLDPKKHDSDGNSRIDSNKRRN